MAINHPSFGMLDDDRIIFFDTTLRDGEQSPGFSMNLEEKLRMAEELSELGVDVIEAGFAIASPGDFESVQLDRQKFAKDGPVIASLGRANATDILRSAEALKPAARKRIHIVLATSQLHMRVKLQMTPEEVLDLTTIQRHAGAGNTRDDVEWSAEDGSRTEPDFLCRCVEAAIKAGATTINIPDTVGYADAGGHGADHPRRCATGSRGSTRSSSPRTATTTSGLAVANTLAAVQAGARQIECTINGIGERAGNASAGRGRDGAADAARRDALSQTSIETPAASCATSQAAVHHHRLRRAAEQGDRRRATPSRTRAASTRTAC